MIYVSNLTDWLWFWWHSWGLPYLHFSDWNEKNEKLSKFIWFHIFILKSDYCHALFADHRLRTAVLEYSFGYSYSGQFMSVWMIEQESSWQLWRTDFYATERSAGSDEKISALGQFCQHDCSRNNSNSIHFLIPTDLYTVRLRKEEEQSLRLTLGQPWVREWVTSHLPHHLIFPPTVYDRCIHHSLVG